MANIADLSDPDIYSIIREWGKEPCLYDPEDVFYKNKSRIKEAHQRMTYNINLDTETQYSIKDITSTVNFLRKEFSKFRKQRMDYFHSSSILPEAPKWWIIMSKFIKDEKYTDTILVDEGDSEETVHNFFDKMITRYLKAEEEYLAELTSEDEEEEEQSSDKTANKNDTSATSKIIDDLNHTDMLKIIKELKSEPCLHNPKSVFYNSQKKRKEAYLRLAMSVNRSATIKYSVEDIMTNVKNLRKEYRKRRNLHIKQFALTKKLPEAPKWWIKLHKTVKDENQLAKKAESIKNSKRTQFNRIKRYLRAEKKYLEELSSEGSGDESAGNYEEDSDSSNESSSESSDENSKESSSDGPPYKKIKFATETDNAGREPKIIESINDLEADMIIQKIHFEPCLRDPKHKFYKNKQKRIEAYQRIADKINDFDNEIGFTASDVEVNMKIIRKEFCNCRRMRIRQYALKKKLDFTDKWWWKLYYLLLDETKYDEKLCVHKPFTKAQVKEKYKKLVSNYKRYEKQCIDGNRSYDEDDYQTEEEILEKTSCTSGNKKFCFKRLSEK